MRKLSLLLMATMLCSCEVGPDYEAPSFALPESWFAEEKKPVADAPLPLDWWTQFNDPTLTSLIEEGLAHNSDIALAAARVAEARAVLGLTEASLYPVLSAEAGASRTSRSRESTFNGTGLSSSKPYNNFTLSAVLDYEISLWGRLSRASESAEAQLLAEKANRDAVRLAVASDIASGYFALLALEEQIAVTKQTIATRDTAQQYQEKQYKAGQIDVLSFERAQAELAAAQSALPALEQSRAEQQQALSVLLGRSPKEIVTAPPQAGMSLAALPVPPALPADAPSALLKRRPDIALAEQTLIATNAEIGVAIADYYPSFSLSALLGLAGVEIDRVLRSSARTWELGANGAMPILDFGRTASNVEAAKARSRQAIAQYQQTVRIAFAEVANALSATDTSARRWQALSQQVASYQETARVARLRYDAGYASQLDLLDAERQLFAAQLDLIAAAQARLGATVTLYKALGGGWSMDAGSAKDAKEATAKN